MCVWGGGEAAQSLEEAWLKALQDGSGPRSARR